MAKTKRGRRDWRALVEGQAASGRSVVAYCREQGVSASQYYRWRRAYGSQRADSGEGGFVELTAVGETPVAGSGVAVVTAHGWRLDVEPGFDAATLERVLGCMMRSGACSP